MGLMMVVRSYGERGPGVIVLHGGPGAVGEVAPVARGLADSFRVLEPWQRGSGEEPLTVARHVEDLHGLIESRPGMERPALVGHSWGAMLALAYAAAHSGQAGPIVLIGCGTFDREARARMEATLEARTDDELRRLLERLVEEEPDPAERMMKQRALTRGLFDFDPVDDEEEEEESPGFDLRAHAETWEDMLRQQERGVYPAAFAAIESPVLMLHGAYDPHPGRMIRASLQPHLPQLEYIEWARCGHSPWGERDVAGAFLEVLRGWIGEKGSREEGQEGGRE